MVTKTKSTLSTMASLASIFALRMLGLFLLLPVLAVYLGHLPDVTPLLVGLAIGIYGLTQAVMQIPMGLLSDRLGRKPVITLGLIIFALGSFWAGSAHSVFGVIIGRALQGAGAISSAVMALAADLTRDEQRTQAMAIIGMTIGVSFAVALVLGPPLSTWLGVPGLFFLIAGLALLAIAVLHLWVPTPEVMLHHRESLAVPEQIFGVLRHRQLLRLDVGIFTLHAVLTGTFVILPQLLLEKAHISLQHHWAVYLPALFISFCSMLPFIIYAEKKRQMKAVFVGAIAVLALSQLALWLWHDSVVGIGIGVFIFFGAFNLLEALLPSLVSKIAPASCKGTALGLYSCAQFFGAFVGAMTAGWLSGHWGESNLFLVLAGVTGAWCILAASMQEPPYLKAQTVPVSPISEAQAQILAQRLRLIPGVFEAVIIVSDGLAYLKVDKKQLDDEALEACLLER